MQFIRAIESARNLAKDYIELIIPFTNPIDIFIRYEDIKNQYRFVYFFGYRMAKDRIIFWGVYDDDRNEIIIDSGCNDIKFQLAKLIKQWKSIGYEHVGAEQRDKFNDRLNFQIFYTGDLNYEDLIKQLTLLAWARGELSDLELLERKYYTKDDKEKTFDQDEMIDYEIKLKKEAEYNDISVDDMLDIREERYNPVVEYSGERYHIGKNLMGGNIGKKSRMVTGYDEKFSGKEEEKIMKLKQEKERSEREAQYRKYKFQYRPIVTYDQYRKLKYNVELYQRTLNKSKYPYGKRAYDSFLDYIKRYSQVNSDLYVQFLYDTQIVPYEENLNFITIDEKILRQITDEQYSYLVNVVVKLRKYLEKTNIVDQYKKNLCPPSMDVCQYEREEDIPKSCELYYYGKQIKYAEDENKNKIGDFL